MLDGGDLPCEPLLLVGEQSKVGGKGRNFVLLLREDLPNLGQPNAKLAKQQHALQPNEGGLVVVAIPIAANTARRDKPYRVVMPQRAARGAGDARHLLNRPFLHVTHRKP